MSTGVIISAAMSDAADLLAVLRAAAVTIDFSASVAAATSTSGAIDISAVAGLSLIARIDAASDQLATLVATPATLGGALVDLVQAFAGTSVDFRGLADALTTVTWSRPAYAQGVNAAATATNRAALQALVVVQATVEAVRASSATSFDSQDAAFSLGNDLSDRLDTLIAGSTSTRALRASLRKLRTALVADISVRAAQLDALASWINPGEVPALVLASRIYDDPTMAADIIARNAISAPLFVAAQTLTILAPDAAS